MTKMQSYPPPRKDTADCHYFGDSIRICIEPDEDYNLEDCDESIRAEFYRLADEYGAYVMFAQYLCPCCGSWNEADSIGCMVYRDIWDEKENGYLPDLIKSAQAKWDEVNAKLNR